MDSSINEKVTFRKIIEALRDIFSSKKIDIRDDSISEGVKRIWSIGDDMGTTKNIVDLEEGMRQHNLDSRQSHHSNRQQTPSIQILSETQHNNKIDYNNEYENDSRKEINEEERY